MRVFAIDPGPDASAFAYIDVATRRPIAVAKLDNLEVARFTALHDDDLLAVEMVASYGMPVGADVFNTCVWIGRFIERHGGDHELVYRRDIKLHHCDDSRAKDSNIAQALVDRFAPGQPNKGKGTKHQPGWFHGFKADIWQAYALAVCVADRDAAREGL